MLKHRKEKVIAMIPVRMGSVRFPVKNLALLNGKPLIYYAIQAARQSRIFDRIVVNSESAVFEKISRRYGVDFYKRPSRLGSSQAKSDSVVYDFMKNNPCDILAWVNPISPLQSAEEIRRVMEYFIGKGLDSLITVKDEPAHCLYKGKPVNFKMGEIFSRTQDLIPVQPFVYSVMIWRSQNFIRAFKKRGHAIFSGKVGFYPVSKLSSLIIKKEEDLLLVQSILKTLNKKHIVRYDPVLKKHGGDR